jgi:hypothetical protein
MFASKHIAEQTADAILALINSMPRSPTKDEQWPSRPPLPLCMLPCMRPPRRPIPLDA